MAGRARWLSGEFLVGVAVFAAQRRMGFIENEAGFLVVELGLPVLMAGIAVSVDLRELPGSRVAAQALQPAVKSVMDPARALAVVEAAHRLARMA